MSHICMCKLWEIVEIASFSMLNCLSGHFDKLPGLNIISTSQNNISVKVKAAMKTERRILIWPCWMNELWSKNLHPCVLSVWLISSILAISWQVCNYYHTLFVFSHHLLYPPYPLSGHDHLLCLASPTKHQKQSLLKCVKICVLYSTPVISGLVKCLLVSPLGRLDQVDPGNQDESWHYPQLVIFMSWK